MHRAFACLKIKQSLLGNHIASQLSVGLGRYDIAGFNSRQLSIGGDTSPTTIDQRSSLRATTVSVSAHATTHTVTPRLRYACPHPVLDRDQILG